MKYYRRFKKVKYRTTDAFGLLPVGSIIDAYILVQDEDSGTALLLHPVDGEGTGSLDFAKCRNDGVFEAVATIHESYINITKRDEKKISRIVKKF